MTCYGYLRVSTVGQTTENQKLAILDHANKNNLSVNHWVEINASATVSSKKRRIDELLEKVNEGDTIIVAELSRLARSVGLIARIVDELIKKKVQVVSIKEGIKLNGKADIQTKIMITLFSLFAEIEQQLISERTKEGLVRAIADGKLVGRPKGSLGKSKLDGKANEIKGYLEKGVSRASVAKIFGVSWPTMDAFIKSRRIK